MNPGFAEGLTIADTACWALCFWWMHRISKRQDALLMELRGQANRIEEVSKAEHDLMKEIHPKVQSIESGMSQVTEATKAGKSAVPKSPRPR
jgi:hypothetical protein